jgi:hypothetical protein
MGAADRADAGLGHPEVVDLAGLDELLDGAGDVLDGDFRVDAVLVEQVDGVGPQATEGALDGGADVVRSAGDAVCLPFSSNANPNLVAMTTSSRTGCSASPTSSSLWKGP